MYFLKLYASYETFSVLWMKLKRLWYADSIERWSLCKLEVMECKEVPWPNSVIEEKHGVEDSGWPSKGCAYECKINLLTGKTHQVGS
jgi:hypothetical protein